MSVERFLEFHDSELVAVHSSSDITRVHLNAYVHQWERTGDSQLGTGWTQSCILELEGAVVELLPTLLPTGLSDGTVRSRSGEGLDGTLTVPSTVLGPCTLELETTSGERVRIVAGTLRVAPSGDPVFVEELPAELAPDR